jgi:hypothetical protein
VYLSALSALAFLDPTALSTQHSANPVHLHGLGTQCTSLATHLILDAYAFNKRLSANACTVSGPEFLLFSRIRFVLKYPGLNLFVQKYPGLNNPV